MAATALITNNPIIVQKNITNGAIAGPVLLSFPTQVIQRGITYNSGTKRFTVPITGIYQVSGTFFKNNAGGDCEVLVGVNTDTPTETNTVAVARIDITSYCAMAVSQAISLNANDYITFYLATGQILPAATLGAMTQVTIVQIG